jgi:hypothetical protein
MAQSAVAPVRCATEQDVQPPGRGGNLLTPPDTELRVADSRLRRIVGERRRV